MERPSATGMPRWVKVFLVVGIVLALTFVVTRLAGVQHGPGLHQPRDGGSPTQPAQHTPPPEHQP